MHTKMLLKWKIKWKKQRPTNQVDPCHNAMHWFIHWLWFCKLLYIKSDHTDWLGQREPPYIDPQTNTITPFPCWNSIYRRFLIRSHVNISLIIPIRRWKRIDGCEGCLVVLLLVRSVVLLLQLPWYYTGVRCSIHRLYHSILDYCHSILGFYRILKVNIRHVRYPLDKD